MNKLRPGSELPEDLQKLYAKRFTGDALHRTGRLPKPYLEDPRRRVLLALDGGVFGAVAVVLEGDTSLPVQPTSESLSRKECGILLLPFSVAYILLLLAAIGTTHTIFDRYTLGLLAPVLIVLLRYYQERVRPGVPFVSILLVGIMAAYGVLVTHTTTLPWTAPA